MWIFFTKLRYSIGKDKNVCSLSRDITWKRGREEEWGKGILIGNHFFLFRIFTPLTLTHWGQSTVWSLSDDGKFPVCCLVSRVFIGLVCHLTWSNILLKHLLSYLGCKSVLPSWYSIFCHLLPLLCTFEDISIWWEWLQQRRVSPRCCCCGRQVLFIFTPKFLCALITQSLNQ